MKNRIVVTATNNPDASTILNVDLINSIIEYNEEVYINVMGQDSSLQVNETVHELLERIDAA